MIRVSLAAALLSLVIAACFHTVLADPGSRIAYSLGGGVGWPDSTSTLRDYWAAAAEHRDPFNWTHDALSGAPEGVSRVPATDLANGAIQTGFIWELRGLLGLVGAWNAFMLLGLLGTGVAMFALLDRLGCSFGASFFGALVFALSPDAIERALAGQPGLLQNWIFPLGLLLLLRLYERTTLARGAAIGALLALGFYVSVWEGLLASFMVVVVLATFVVLRHERRERLRLLGAGAVALSLPLAAISPILLVYERERSAALATLGFYTHAATGLAYLLPSPRNPLFRWLSGLHSPAWQEETLYIGTSTLLLAGAALVLLARRDRFLMTNERQRAAIAVSVLGVAALVWSFGAHYDVGGVSIPLPAAVLGVVTSDFRLDARWGLLVGFALVTLAALALSALRARGGLTFRLLTPAAIIVAAVELFPGTITTFNTAAVPPWVGWLSREPSGIVAVYPWQTGTGLLDDVWYQTIDHHPRFVDLHDETAEQMGVRLLARDLWRPLTAKVLATEGVRYVVVLDGETPDSQYYKLLRRFGAVGVYAVSAPHVDLAAALRDNAGTLGVLQALPTPSLSFGAGFNPAESYQGGTGRWLAQNGRLSFGNTGSPMKVVLSGVAFSNASPRVLELVDAAGHVVERKIIPAYATPIRFGPLSLPTGTTSFTLVARPGPQILGPSDLREASVFLDQLTASPIPAYIDEPGGTSDESRSP